MGLGIGLGRGLWRGETSLPIRGRFILGVVRGPRVVVANADWWQVLARPAAVQRHARRHQVPL